MAKYGPGWIAGMAALGFGGFVLADHFLLKDKFGVWLKIEELIKGFAPHSGIPLGTSATGSNLFAIPSKVGSGGQIVGTKATAGAKAIGSAGITLRTPKTKTPRATAKAGAGAGTRVGVTL